MLNHLIYSLKRPYHFLKTGLGNGLPAQIRYGFPGRDLHITMITGTDGKTSSSTLLYHVLKQAGVKVALLTTVAAYLGEQEIDTGFHVTSPQPADLLQFIHNAEAQDFTHLVLEVTSHGSHQFRTWGVKPQFAGITNVSPEHLDYHLTYDEYLRAKARILQQANAVVLNADDQSYTKLRRFLPSAQYHVLTYSQEEELPKEVQKAINQRFPEQYNRMNARLVYKLARLQLVSPEHFIEAVQSFAGIVGRMQEVPTKKPYTVIVDFAHTPQGLEAALTELRKRLKKQRKGKLIAVFGCAGLRDRAKRPVMGKIATDLADLAVFTAEDPRTENVWSIIRQMKEQLKENHDKVISIADRGKAIEFALTNLAKPGDIIGIFGKGHEQSMCYGTEEIPWSDQRAVQRIAGK